MTASPYDDAPEKVMLKDHPSFTTFNPELLDDGDYWPMSCLEGLCVKLSLNHEGEREDLVSRLKLWHVQKYSSQGLHGGNFHLLPVKETTVPHPYLSPFKRIQASDRRPILRKRSRFSNSSNPPRFSRRSSGGRRSSLFEDENEDERNSKKLQRTSIGSTESSQETARSPRKKTVQFSPYNKVQLMSPRKVQGVRLFAVEEAGEEVEEEEEEVSAEWAEERDDQTSDELSEDFGDFTDEEEQEEEKSKNPQFRLTSKRDEDELFHSPRAA